MKKEQSDIGRRIVSIQREKNISCKTLADASNSTQTYIYGLRNGRIQCPSAERLLAMAGCLGVRIEYLITGERHTIHSHEYKSFYQKYKKLSPEQKRIAQQILNIVS